MPRKKPLMEESSKRVFRAMIMPTADPSVWDKWDRSVGILSPKFCAAKNVFPGQEISLLIAFSGYGTDPHMMADIDFRWTLTNEIGVEMMGENWMPAVKGRVLHGDFVLRQNQKTSLRIPEELPPGGYELKLQSRCHVSSQESDHSVLLEVKECKIGTPMLKDEALGFVEAYLDNPEPGVMWDSYLGVFDTIAKESPDSFFAHLPFFAQIMIDNPWLGPVAEKCWQDLSPAHQSALSFVFHAVRMRSSLPGLQAMNDQRSKFPFPSIPQLLQNPVSHPQELDFLWSIFKACGRYDVFKHICTAVSVPPEALAAVTDENTQDAVIKAAAWSIQQNIDHSPLAMTYAMALFKESDLEIKVYRLLEGLLKAKGWVPNPDYVGP